MSLRLIIDAHLDIASNAVMKGRDFLLSVDEKRIREASHEGEWGTVTLGLPELLRANVRVVFATIWVCPCSSPELQPTPCYNTPEEAYNQARQQLSYYLHLARDPRVMLIRTRSDLDQVIDGDERRLGIVLLMEGAGPLLKPKNVKEWFDAGVRIIAPAWRGTRYAGGTGEPGSLTPAGRELMTEMEQTGLILDFSHLAEASFYEALELFEGPVIASHSNCRALVPGDRHLSDDMIRTLVKRDGITGMVLYNAFLRAGWKEAGKIKAQVTLADLIKQIQHVCRIAGDTSHIGIGSDLDGGFGAESIPIEFDTAADLIKIEGALAKAGFSEKDIDNALYLNWLKMLRKSLPDNLAQ